jgi:signal transduction histidine kinase
LQKRNKPREEEGEERANLFYRGGIVVMVSGFLKNAFGRISVSFLVLLIFAFVFSAQAADVKEVEGFKEAAKATVHTAAVGLGAILKNVKTDKERIDIIRTFTTPIRFYPDKSGYFYAYDFDCVNIAHATQKDLEGKNLYDHKDTKGKYVIRELSAAAKKGGGFVEFYWAKPGEKSGEFRKLGYVEPIPGTKFFIGTGVYLP